MVMINLLPWREWKQAYENAVVKKIMVGTFLLHVVIVFGVYLFLKEINREHKTRLNHLMAQIKKENVWQNQAKMKPHLNPEIKINHVLLQDQLAILPFFHLLQKNRPHALCFTEINHNKNHWLLMGKTQNIIDLMTYLKSWASSSRIASVNISYLKQQSNSWQFRLFVIEKKPFHKKFLS